MKYAAQLQQTASTLSQARTDPSRAQQDTAKLVTEHHQLGSSTEADTDEASQAGPDPGPRAHAASHTDTDIFLALQAKLNFKYPRACKTLLLLWCMAHLRHSSKDSLPIHAVYERYCQDVTTKQRVPQADFAPELVKALALLTISPHKVQANDQQIFKGIAWRGVSISDQTCVSIFADRFSHLHLAECLLSLYSVCSNSVHAAHVAASFMTHMTIAMCTEMTGHELTYSLRLDVCKKPATLTCIYIRLNRHVSECCSVCLSS